MVFSHLEAMCNAVLVYVMWLLRGCKSTDSHRFGASTIFMTEKTMVSGAFASKYNRRNAVIAAIGHRFNLAT
jgi:hypothetical protein